ncbi:calcium-binding and coiled-coil domain-containing protein 2 isoform X2 [Neoarius graeffei]|uniref:calcium-binding and coiled-coil domain-containing protein 2 isoform X2 n=1 Tax=Neoarius graeffei TaxID=443677 RepID=UPI00298C1816|nr:calcium-binding and coiled-coil domain-containing protein 2 isoform X2 [Neoarius graeffei]
MSASAVEDAVGVAESSMYSQVVFIDVPPSYPLQTDVTCFYKLTGGLIQRSSDWIAIYKVGWDKASKYHCYEWVKPCLDYKGLDPPQQQIAFKECYLPKDDGEFYQFCYVDGIGQVRGASTPFCFQNPAETSLDCSLLVISTQEQVEQMEKEKEALLTEMKQLKENHDIIKNELNERLQEICHLRRTNEKLKSNSTSEAFPLKEQPESPAQDILEQPFLSETMTETKPEKESLTLLHEKYEKAVQKIHFLKHEKVQLEQQTKENDAEISELKLMLKKKDQDYNRLQDQFQLQQVDMQSNQKEKERLCVELEEMRCDLERLQEENKALKASLSKQGPPEGDKSDTKILNLTSELTEVRGALRKEILSRNDAITRAEQAEIGLKELKLQLDKRTVTENSQIETEFAEARRRIREQENIAEVLRQEKETLCDENKAKVCRHCQESFPDITEDELVIHEQSHKVCPFCTLICDDWEQQEFEDHVYSHEE